MILGLTGSVGSGKSTVADMLSQMAGAVIVDADAIVYELQQPGQDCLEEIVREFGDEILAADGSLDRKKLGSIVFQKPDRLARLNAIMHPRVWDTMVRRVTELAHTELVVLMVPLLFEIGADRLCDAVAVVTLSEKERERRLRERDNLTPEQILERLAAQMPQEQKVQRADYLIDNSGSIEQTLEQVRAMVEKLRSMAHNS